MEIENVKTWHWALAGIFAGLLFSAVLRIVGPAFDTQARNTVEQGEFENRALDHTRFDSNGGRIRVWLETYHKDQPVLIDVTIHPPLSGDPAHSWVTGREYWVGLKPVDATKIGGPEQICEEWKPFRYQASIPYKPGYTEVAEKKHGAAMLAGRAKWVADLKSALGGNTEYPTVKEYLKAVAAVPESTFKYRYAWYELPMAVWSMPPLTGLLLIGVAWPLSLSIMQNYGMAKPTIIKTKAKPIEPPHPMPRPSTAGVVVKPPVPTPPPPPTEDERKYGGEFYPVVKSTGKH